MLVEHSGIFPVSSCENMDLRKFSSKNTKTVKRFLRTSWTISRDFIKFSKLQNKNLSKTIFVAFRMFSEKFPKISSDFPKTNVVCQ